MQEKDEVEKRDVQNLIQRLFALLYLTLFLVKSPTYRIGVLFAHIGLYLLLEGIVVDCNAIP